MKKEKILILGSGTWAIALATVLLNNNHQVLIWTHKEHYIDNIKNIISTHCGDISNLSVFSEKSQVTEDISFILTVVPSRVMRQVLSDWKPFIPKNSIIVNASKGFDNEKNIRLSQLITELLPESSLAILSGPSHAEEVVNKMATAIVVASEDIRIAEFIQDIFTNEYFRVYTNTDFIGVELGGAIKNVIALGVGIIVGTGLGDNSKAAFITRGSHEMARLGVAMGASRSTFSGLSGMGDLIVTCDSNHSRNRKAGMLLGQGKSLIETLEAVEMEVEGVYAAKTAYGFSHLYNLNMPITTEVYKILYEGKDPKDSVKDLMSREPKSEAMEYN